MIPDMHRDLPRLEKTELLARLAQGHGARITVVTPNRRLAQFLRAEFDGDREAEGLGAWETADILPFEALVERLWDDALYCDLAPGVPVLLTPAQEQALWEDAIAGNRPAERLFSAPAAAAQCREAWLLAHAWRIELTPGPHANDDARAFLDWAARYQRATREAGRTDRARLPDVMAPHLGHAGIRLPKTLVLYGFDIVAPQVRDFLEALAAHGCTLLHAQPTAHSPQVSRVEFTEPRDEILAAARWARSRLAAGCARIAIVVPDLTASRAKVQRLLARVLQPGHALGEDSALPFDVSLGEALVDFPLVADALRVLALGGPACAFEDASRVIRSSFVAGAESEMAVRARLDAKLRERCPPSLRLESLQRLATVARYPQAPVLIDRLERLAKIRKTGTGAKPASDWARIFSDALRAAGFPGERTLDSNEYQALEKWHDLLAQFANLEAVTPAMDYARALERVERMARDTIFQPQARDVPIQVLGVLESAGLEFDHLWVMGLTDEAWPLPARPNPFVPARLQRAAGVPQADPVTSLDLDQRITEGWMHAAPEVVFSHARLKGESELASSPLVKSLPLISFDELRVEEYPLLRDAIRAQGAIETLEDAKAPVVVDTGATQHGGTSLFRDQAACPFKAFAKHRLDSDPLETPRPGLNARDRGSLVHNMMAAVWKSLGTSEALAAASPADLDKLLAACADEAIAQVRKYRADVLSGRFGELERDRLVRIAREWLEAERMRGVFQVVEMEQKHALTFGGVTVNVKLDRMDRLARGGHAVIDYKTGACATSAWLGPRPEEPQLPMYALSVKDVVAVAFGQVKTGEMSFKGVSRDPDILPRVDVITKNRSPAAREYRDWNSLLQGWRGELEAAGQGFASGDARVDPKRGALTCSICEQKMLCRIAEKAPFGAVGAGEPDE